MKPIYVLKSFVPKESIQFLRNVLKTGWIGLGSETAKFESEFNDYLGGVKSVGLNSATSGLHLAMILADVKKDDYVITTPMTFISTNASIMYVGARPIFVDINSQNMNIDFNKIIDAIEKNKGKVKAIIIVHYGGIPFLKRHIQYLNDNYPDISVIQDCSHALGSKFEDGTMIGSFGDLNVFSLHAVKNIGTPDGGVLVTQREEYYKRCVKLRWLGIDKSTYNRANDGGYSWYYNIDEIGYKYHMNDVTAAIARGQLINLDECNARRRYIIDYYYNNIKNARVIMPDYGIASGHLAVAVLEKGIDRDLIVKSMKSKKIYPSVHYYPNNEYSMFKNFKYKTPIAKEMFYRIITLPCHLGMTDKDIFRVTDVFNKLIGN